MKINYCRQRLLTALALCTLFSVCLGSEEFELLIPAKTQVSAMLLSPISTATAKKDDKFTCKILSPAEFAGAVIEGHIRSAKRSGKANKDSKIDLAFDRIVLVDGRMANFSATVLEVFDVPAAGDQGRADNEGTVRNRSTSVKTSVKRALIGAGIGAVVGGIIAGGQGAAVGAGIGAAVGVTTTLASKGEDLEFKTGTQFTIQTNGPTRRRSLRNGETAIAIPPPSTASTEQAAPKSKDTEAEPTISKVATDNHPVLKPTSLYKPPPLPAAQTKVYNGPGFTTVIPENWRVSASKSLVTVSPEGGAGLYGGQPELTHGAMFARIYAGTSDLKQATEKFLAAALKRNSYLRRKGEQVPVAIDSKNGLATTLTGIGREGRMELISIYTVISSDGKLFYVITTVPEAEAETYTVAFKTLIQSLRFTE